MMRNDRSARRLLAGVALLGATLGAAAEVSARPPAADFHHSASRHDGGATGSFGALNEPTPLDALARARVEHARNLERLPGRTSAAGRAATRDVDVDGDATADVAVVADNGRIVIPARDANPLDLPSAFAIRYTPTGPDAYRVEPAAIALDQDLGPELNLTDDSFQAVLLSAPFSLLGKTYSTMFVGSDGHITFEQGDGGFSARDAARHVGGPPRLSALLTDLNPECGGAVHADVRADRAVVTWDRVVHFQRGVADGCASEVPTNTVQATLHADGRIDYVFGPLDNGIIGQPGGNQEAVTGIAEGHSEGPLHEIDMTRDLPVKLGAGAIFEEFAPAAPEGFDIVELSREFYKTHPDKFDFLVMFTDFDIFGGGTAFSAFVKNQTLGLGQGLIDNSSVFGSAGELENFVWMNNINLWAGNKAQDYLAPPVHPFAVTTSPRLSSFVGGDVTPTRAPYETFGMLDITGNGRSNGYSHHGRAMIHENPHTEERASRGALRYSLNSPVSVMFQEADHRWAAFVAFVHPTKGIRVPDSFDLLGRGLAHWSTFFNTRVADSPFALTDGNPRFSGMEGNAILELQRDARGRIVDKADVDRAVADPDGKLAAGIQACEGQGKSLFLTEPDELIDGATELDQYLMGVRRSADVSGFWYVDDPSSPLDGRSLDEPFPGDFLRGSAFNVDDIGFCGVRVNLTVDSIADLGRRLGIPARGPRVPAIGDENDVGPRDACLAENLGGSHGRCVDVKTMAWILLVKNPPSSSSIHRLNEFRKAWQFYASGPGLDGRNADGVVRPPSHPDFIAKFDTSLNPRVH